MVQHCSALQIGCSAEVGLPLLIASQALPLFHRPRRCSHFFHYVIFVVELNAVEISLAVAEDKMPGVQFDPGAVLDKVMSDVS